MNVCQEYIAMFIHCRYGLHIYLAICSAKRVFIFFYSKRISGNWSVGG